jgi:hypothetical protein
MISDFGHNVDEICALLGYYAVLSGCSVLMFQDNLLVAPLNVKKSDFSTLDDGTDTVS